jgi:hypothetical protein
VLFVRPGPYHQQHFSTSIVDVEAGQLESDERVRRGHITKQGSPLVRWAAVEAVARQRGDTSIRAHHLKVGESRGKQIGRVAAARKLLILVYYGWRATASD